MDAASNESFVAVRIFRKSPFGHATRAAGIAALLFACSSEGSSADPPAPGPDADAGVEASTPPAEPLAFKPCPLRVDADGPDAECATALTPLDAANPGGPTIEMFVKRYRPAGGKGLRAMWMLQGGPGASAYVFESIAQQIGTRFPDVDFYMPDHRGTGKSTRLGCPAQESPTSEAGIAITDAEWPACLADVKAREGERLAAFNTTNAANDLGVLIERTKQEGQPVFVYGVSYGTYWAHRYLQLYPSQANGVIFDSMVPQGGSLARQDEDSGEAARDLFAVCGKDAFCSQKLGTDPWPKVQALFAKLKTGHCSDIALPDFPNHILFRRAFAGLLMDVNLRPYIPAIVHRLDRCEAKDITALKVLVGKLTQEQPESPMMKQWSWVVTYNIAFSELWETPEPTAELLESLRENSVASRDVTLGMQATMGMWPRYKADPRTTSYAQTNTPLLFLNGGLDPATLLRKARPVREHFQGPNHYWVEVPTAGHTVIASSTTSEKRSCGTRMMMSFMEKPDTAPDTSCIADVLPIDFPNGRVDYNQALFGTNDAWE
jgi:pimeloyl-ACP methyl ester carboxylesterase